MDNLMILVGLSIPVIGLLGMALFGLYTRRNFFWVLASFLWGALVYTGILLLTPNLQLDGQIASIAFAPLFQQGWIALGVFLVLWREKFDNLVDGAVYGMAAGLGYAAYENFVELLPLFAQDNFLFISVQAVSISLIYLTASGIIGIAVTQFYFRHRDNRAIFLLSGLGAGIGFVALYKMLAFYRLGGEFLAAAFGIGGMTFVGLYIVGLLRKILIQVGVEKSRADSLLEIVIPIGVELSTEEKFGNLLETMLIEAKEFCHADGGMLYLLKDDQLHYAVVRNDTLKIAMGGASGNEISYPPLHLAYQESGAPNHSNIVTHAALSGETVNILDAYENEDFDFTDTKAFDQSTGYLTVSFLIIPLKDSEENILGILELFNAYDPKRKIFIPFDKNLQQLMESFSSLASAALQGYIKEQNLRREIKELRIEIDAVKREQQVAEITDTNYFKELQEKAKGLRNTQKD
jgi:GAF domain-containing protein/RsiW-degrading membrane proteinase PrsW (M82 family)